MFLIIGIWGGKRRVYASFKFFLYTLDRLAADAARDHGDVWRRRNDRYRHPADDELSRSRCRHGSGSPSSPRSPSRCRCGRCIPGCPMPMSRRRPRARSSSPRILLKMGGYGFIRFSLADVSGCLGLFRPARLRAVDHRDHLHLARRAGAGGHEEADRLFIRGAYGLRDHGSVHHDACRASRALCSR